MLTQLEGHNEFSLNVPMSLPWFPCELQSPQPGGGVCVCVRGEDHDFSFPARNFLFDRHHASLQEAAHGLAPLQACFQIPL